MKRTGGIRESSRRASLGRIAAAAVAVCGLSALAFAPGIAAAASTPRTASEISTAENAKLGTILEAGNTVYTLKPSKTNCATKCMKSWLPVLLPKGIKKATAGTGVDASKLGTASAANGALQVTYAGKRLYWFVKDKVPGEVHGNVTNDWGKWSTVVTAKPGAAPSSTVRTALAPATTVAPQTDPAPTVPPQTAPPQTAPPETAPPATSPPQTSPPKTNPPNPPRWRRDRVLMRTSLNPAKTKEPDDVKRAGAQRDSNWRASVGRIVATAIALSACSALVLASSVATAATAPRSESEISTAKNDKLGTILVAGNTVYTLKASKTACSAECTKVWLPVLLPPGVTEATAGSGVDASKLGTAHVANEALQVTYGGKPLYWYAKDKKPGQVHGNVTNKWGKWSTVVTAKSSSGTSDTKPGTSSNGF